MHKYLAKAYSKYETSLTKPVVLFILGNGNPHERQRYDYPGSGTTGVIHLIEGAILSPRIIGKTGHSHPVLIIATLLFAEQFRFAACDLFCVANKL